MKEEAFVQMEFIEEMIDHLDLESTITLYDSVQSNDNQIKNFGDMISVIEGYPEQI